MKRIMFLLLPVLLLGLSFFGCAEGGDGNGDGGNGDIVRVDDNRNLNSFEYSLMNLTATDALGRSVPIADGKKQGDRYVGLFYSVWLGQHKHQQTGIWNVQYLIDTDPDALNSRDSQKSPLGEFHYWGQPLYGYYSSKDPWVIARHVEILTMAGIDYLCLDNTNAKVYKDSTDVLMDTLLKFQQQGFDVPKVVFYTNSDSGVTVDEIYSNYYQTEKYQSIWFAPNGKPMIIGITENNNKASDQTKYYTYSDFIKPEMQEFFDVKESEWPNGDFHEDSIPWMSWQYPQNIHNGAVSVPVAQHSHSRISASWMHPESHRGYNNNTKRVDSDWTEGKSFQTMWDTVHNAPDGDITNVHVTGFNEWMAIKQHNSNDGVYFVDVYNNEYSRDIEMMKGGYGDNYLLQLIANIREYKFTSAKHYKYKQMSIDIHSPAAEAQWSFITAAYKDFVGDAMPRSYENASGTGHYTDTSNRNDIKDIKVTHDNTNLYFRIETADIITEHNGSDLNWMNVLIKTGGADSFAGYDYIINRSPQPSGKTSVEKSSGGFVWTPAGQAEYKVDGKIMQIRIPLSALGLTAKNCAIEFKVADNVSSPDDIMDYYISGDSAPIGRLSFSYGY